MLINNQICIKSTKKFIMIFVRALSYLVMPQQKGLHFINQSLSDILKMKKSLIWICWGINLVTAKGFAFWYVKKSHQSSLLGHISKIQNGLRQPFWIFRFTLKRLILHRHMNRSIFMIFFPQILLYCIKYSWTLILTHVQAAVILFLHTVHFFSKTQLESV